MKHALSVGLVLLAGGLAGCAAEHGAGGSREMYYSRAAGGWEPRTRPVATRTGSIATGARSAARAGQEGAHTPAGETAGLSPEQLQRDRRRVYAQGLERILVSNGINVSVTVYEGQVAPTPTLMFLGHFSEEFVSKALTTGAVLKRARDLGFRSVDFFERGPEGHYQFMLSQTAPLPECAAYQRLCL